MTLSRQRPAAPFGLRAAAAAAALRLVVGLAVVLAGTAAATTASLPENVSTSVSTRADDSANPGANPGAAPACTLHLQEHRSGQTLLQLPLPAGAPPQLQLAFTHSVLGTPVQDHYTWQAGQWHLTEEHFEGEGYGLPHTAAPGETLQRHGNGWRLLLNRPVAPLVVRPLPAQHMRLQLPDGRQWLLATLSNQAIEVRTQHC